MRFDLKLDERVPQRFLDSNRPVEPQRESVKFEAGQVVQLEPAGHAPGPPVMVLSSQTQPVAAYVRELNESGGCFFVRGEFVERHGRLLSPAPRAGDTWTSGESVARLELCAHGDTSLRIVSEGEPFVGDVVAVARRLWEGGYRVAQRAPSFEEMLAKDPIAQALVAKRAEHGAGKWVVYGPRSEDRERAEKALNNATRDAFREAVRKVDEDVARSICGSAGWVPQQSDPIADVKRAVREHAQKWIDRGVMKPPQHFDCRLRCTDLLDSTRVDRATGDDLRKLAELHGVPDARYQVEMMVTNGHWRIVTPDVTPLASLANAVAAIFERPDLATSRRYIDTAIATLRGEPFSGAIAAALVGVAERTALAPVEIAACIAALRHWEARRPFDRDLRALQRRTGDRLRGGPWNRLQCECNELLAGIVGRRPDWDYDSIYFVYERARTV